jgi:uncharacterized protein
VFGILNQIEIEEVLRHQVIGRIGCHSDSVTYVIPISYAYDGKNIFAHTLEGMKIGMMRKNTNVCFEVDSISNLDNWQSVICWGSFKELVNPDERQNALEKLHIRNLPVSVSATAKLSPQYPFLPRDFDSIEGVVFRIQLYKKTGKFEKRAVTSV